MSKKKKRAGDEVRAGQLSAKELADAISKTPIRHQALSPETLAACRYTFSRAGKYIQPNLEKWELGFMRDANPDKELGFWMRVCLMLEVINPSDPKKFVIDCCRSSIDGNWTTEVKEAWERITGEDIRRAVRDAFREAELAGE